MKILITGAAGYLGANLVNHLVDTGHEVIGLDRIFPDTSRAWYNKMHTALIADIREESTFDDISALKPEAVVHTISLDHNRSETDSKETCITNVLPAWRLLERLTTIGLDRFVYFSTQQVYGKTGPVTINEDLRPSPVNAYGLTHLMSEQIVELYEKRTDTLCINIRISNGFGAPLFRSCNCWWLVINDFCKTAVESGEIHLASDGSPQRDFIHIQDICQAVNLLLTTPRSSVKHRCYNVGSGETFTILELAHLVRNVCKNVLKRDIPVIMPDKTISQDAGIHKSAARFRYDTSRIRELGFKNTRSLEQGIIDVLSYLQNAARK
ncbi:MAG TPA: NAD(P)-dependent oxidoreductase [Elusimicrobiota bacterium]|nr:NAD(P)-dependent oxidoreductase [Elusimicrobiota bacterium]